MNKYLLIGLIVLLTTGVVIGTSEVLFKYKAIIYSVEYSEGNNSSVALFVEEDGTYAESLSNELPVDMNFNSEKSYCVHGGSVSYDEGTSKLKVSSSGSDKCYVYFDMACETGTKYGITSLGSFSDKIINDNNTTYDEIDKKCIPDFSSFADTHEGLFSTDDVYGASYYFRGAVDNNWVKFGKQDGKEIWWRIIRINGDGSIRLVYSGTTAPSSEQSIVIKDNGVLISSKSSFNSPHASAEYTGYMYTLGESHGTSTDSIIKGVVDEWYNTHLSGYSEYISHNTSFCYNRTSYIDEFGYNISSGIGDSAQYFKSYVNLYKNKVPSLLCDNINDYYTVNSSDNGNNALSNPIGLVSADEVSLAGLVYLFASSGNYLYTDNNYMYSKSDYWLGSPFKVDLISSVFTVLDSGKIFASSSNASYGVRTTLSLKKDLSISGTGTYNDPYVVLS